MNEKIKRKAHVKQSFSLDFLERGTFTEYPYRKKLLNAKSVQLIELHAFAYCLLSVSLSESFDVFKYKVY